MSFSGFEIHDHNERVLADGFTEFERIITQPRELTDEDRQNLRRILLLAQVSLRLEKDEERVNKRLDELEHNLLNQGYERRLIEKGKNLIQDVWRNHCRRLPDKKWYECSEGCTVGGIVIVVGIVLLFVLI